MKVGSHANRRGFGLGRVSDQTRKSTLSKVKLKAIVDLFVDFNHRVPEEVCVCNEITLSWSSQ